MSIQHLIPTPIIDKNGKRTTVHKKSQSASTGKALPAPSLTAGQRERARLAKDIMGRLNSDERNAIRQEWTKNSKIIEQHLKAEQDTDYLTRLQELCIITIDEGVITDLWQLNTIMTNNGKDVINALYSHLDWIKANPGYTTRFAIMHKALVHTRRVQPDSNGKIPCIEQHLVARAFYDKQRYSQMGYAIIKEYEANIPYMEMVEKYVDHIEALFTYRSERGLDADPVAFNPVDDADFKEYLKHQNLKDGWL